MRQFYLVMYTRGKRVLVHVLFLFLLTYLLSLPYTSTSHSWRVAVVSVNLLTFAAIHLHLAQLEGGRRVC